MKKGMDILTAASLIEEVLGHMNVHLSTHTPGISFLEGGYCYTNEDGYNYSNCRSIPVPVLLSLQLEWIQVFEDGTLTGCNLLEGVRI